MTNLTKRPDTIVLVHGFWVTPRSWEHWVTRYEARGYRVLAPAYPGFEVEVEALNRDPSPVERLTVPAIMAHLEVVIEELAGPPILIGH
jgi:pimeloyl-ACP methyl ester carboxylesterase